MERLEKPRGGGGQDFGMFGEEGRALEKTVGILEKDRYTQTHILRLLSMHSRHSVVSEGKRRYLLASKEALLWSTQK